MKSQYPYHNKADSGKVSSYSIIVHLPLLRSTKESQPMPWC